MTEERLREIEVDISKREWAPFINTISPADAALVRDLIDEVRRLRAQLEETYQPFAYVYPRFIDQ